MNEGKRQNGLLAKPGLGDLVGDRDREKFRTPCRRRKSEDACLLRVVHEVSLDSNADLSGVTVIVDLGVDRSRTNHAQFDVLVSVLFSDALHVRIHRGLAGRIGAGPRILKAVGN